MAHKGETQSTSDEMPRIPHTIQRGGVYCFNARYPTELVERGVVRKTHYKRSLRTKDMREAKARTRSSRHSHYGCSQRFCLRLHCEIPTQLGNDIDDGNILDTMQRDKKIGAGQIRFVLLKQTGIAFVSGKVSSDHLSQQITALR
jgi:3-dehydroquinate synthetase